MQGLSITLVSVFSLVLFSFTIVFMMVVIKDFTGIKNNLIEKIEKRKNNNFR